MIYQEYPGDWPVVIYLGIQILGFLRSNVTMFEKVTWSNPQYLLDCFSSYSCLFSSASQKEWTIDMKSKNSTLRNLSQNKNWYCLILHFEPNFCNVCSHTLRLGTYKSVLLRMGRLGSCHCINIHHLE